MKLFFMEERLKAIQKGQRSIIFKRKKEKNIKKLAIANRFCLPCSCAH